MSVSESYDGQDARAEAAAGGRGRRVEAARLSEELRALGRSLDGPAAGVSEAMVERVLEQIRAERLPVPVPEAPRAGERLRAVRHWARARWRALTAALCGLLTVLALTPPVRAAVIDWFDFGGVEVRYDPTARPSPGAEVPDCGKSMSLTQARHRTGFTPLVPDALGTPDGATVTGEPGGRFLVSLCWREHGHTVRLDEYPARLDVGFVKKVSVQPEWITLDPNSSGTDASDFALWFRSPHLLRFCLVDVDGVRYTRKERTAGPTLLWMHETRSGQVTLRLEGAVSKNRAMEIARSVVPEPDTPSK
ncbi:hypothetical protein [Streptomyces chiangmaiensis]|uniref:Uncharacterized protein n=1 Tax=Streptomyces chiangmaiensis TaxID=766497 RepID=A0ABU7FS89_9ACTN|nr:hypothetical protein [Streptomyces chiangmaiensis]MED7826962.1 hypothetical protein [Streptomyces chiangmaiensis]